MKSFTPWWTDQAWTGRRDKRRSCCTKSLDFEIANNCRRGPLPFLATLKSSEKVKLKIDICNDRSEPFPAMYWKFTVEFVNVTLFDTVLARIMKPSTSASSVSPLNTRTLPQEPPQFLRKFSSRRHLKAKMLENFYRFTRITSREILFWYGLSYGLRTESVYQGDWSLEEDDRWDYNHHSLQTVPDRMCDRRDHSEYTVGNLQKKVLFGSRESSNEELSWAVFPLKFFL